MKRYKAVLLSIVLLATLGLVACSSGDSGEASDGDIVEISFFHRFTDSPNKEYFDGAVKRFEEQNPGVKVNVSSAINDDYKQKINVLMGNESPPDVFFTWAGEYSYKFARAGQALDLTEYAGEGSALKEQVIPTQLEPYTFDDKVYGVPIIMDGKAFFYNKDIFDELNLEEPTSWEEFIDVLVALKESDYTALSFGNQSNWAVGHYLTTMNQRMLDPEQLHSDYTRTSGEFTDPGYVEVLEKLLELEPYFSNMPNAVTDDAAINAFVNKEAAIYYNQFNQYQYIEPGDFEIGWFNFPMFENGKGDPNELTGSPQGFMVSSKTKHPDEAVKFLEFLTSSEEASRMVEEIGMISSSVGGVNEDNASEQIIELVKAIEDASAMNIWMDISLDARIAEVYLNGATEMLNGQKTPEEVMDDVQKVAEEAKASAE